jgi:uncharacterized damage-inducible protein DinB
MSHDVIDRYELGAEVLTYAAQGLTPEQEAAHPGPGDWSLAQLAAHLLDTDLVYADRMKRLIAEEGPTLVAFDENAWAQHLDYASSPVAESVALFAANRRRMARILRKCTDADFARSGRHTEAGPQTLAEVLAYITNHLDHHLKFLYAKRANLGIALYPRYTRP